MQADSGSPNVAGPAPAVTGHVLTLMIGGLGTGSVLLDGADISDIVVRVAVLAQAGEPVRARLTLAPSILIDANLQDVVTMKIRESGGPGHPAQKERNRCLD